MNFRRFEGYDRLQPHVMSYSEYVNKLDQKKYMGRREFSSSLPFFFVHKNGAMFSFASGCCVIKMNIIVFPYININEMFTLLTVASIFDIHFSMFT